MKFNHLESEIMSYLKGRFGTIELTDKATVEDVIGIFKANGWQPPEPATQNWRAWVAAYTNWYSKRTNIKARTTSGDLKALKEIARYLTEVSDGDQAKALASFNTLLANWHLLSEWMQKQVGLTSINKHLTEIIEQLRSHGQRPNHTQAKSFADDFKNRRQ